MLQPSVTTPAPPNATNHVTHVEPVLHASGVKNDSCMASSIKSKQDCIEASLGVSLQTLVNIDTFTKLS